MLSSFSADESDKLEHSQKAPLLLIVEIFPHHHHTSHIHCIDGREREERKDCSED
jgi:hypothetical protein